MQKSLILISIIFCFAKMTLFSQTAPDFTITDSDGVIHELYADYLNQGKTVLIKVFFVNCPPCRAVAPSMQDLYVEWGEGNNDVQFIELSNKSFDSNTDVAGYKSTFGLTFPSAGADGGSLEAVMPYMNGTFGSFFGTPEFAVISPDGSVNFGVSGPGISGTISALDNAIAATGAEKPSLTVEPININFAIKDAFGQDIENAELVLTSANGGQEFPLNLINDSFTIDDPTPFQTISNPIIRVSKNDGVTDNLSVSDILPIVRHVLNVNQITDSNLLVAADTDNNGNIDVLDILTLQRVILGVFDSFPNDNPSYKFIPEEYPINLNLGTDINIEITGIKVGNLDGN